MARLSNFYVIENNRIAAGTFAMLLFGDCGELRAPGQFVGVELPEFFLRRPFSVSRRSGSVMTLVYKTVGEGTRAMSGLREGSGLNLLTGLGNGFDLSKCGGRPLLVGGGAGAAPMYWLAESLLELGKKPVVVLGFNTASEIFLAAELAVLGARVLVSTADGSAGARGFVTDAIAAAGLSYDYVFACGPEPMLRAVYDMSETDGQYSFEARMACGFGACMGCTCRTKYGPKRICKDGPVLFRDEIVWQSGKDA